MGLLPHIRFETNFHLCTATIVFQTDTDLWRAPQQLTTISYCENERVCHHVEKIKSPPAYMAVGLQFTSSMNRR
jgi:hypothetical protein